MRISLSSSEALAELKSLFDLGEKPGFEFPAFNIETEFIDFFFQIISNTPTRDNVVPFMNRLIERALAESINNIWTVLAHQKADGTEIFELMKGKQLICLRVKRSYNRNVPGKSPKGLISPYWNAYNNWLLAHIFWKAYLQAHDPDFRVINVECEDSDAPVETLYSADFKPLWAMKQAYIAARRPTGGSDIFIRPIAEWYLYRRVHRNEVLPKMRFNRV
ncbi:hypothetical protein A3860_38785 [Niastella vici]|uniref:Uncharacterized protein n=1 Tax=Niastella vici TaxID=1703345 RepID=A0A1V9FL96_9BACT|nr:hypothetical protein [Niastella vici]OQP59118.1 hypothetical protein A3860_38785 [Niastella vici]